MFRERGAFTFSADEAQRAVMARGTPGHLAVVRRFGGAVRPDGCIDRAALASIVFADAGERSALEALLHPPIMGLLAQQVHAVRDEYPYGALIVVEVPLLYEAGLQESFEGVVVVALEPEEQLRRAIQRGVSPGDARSRVGAQMSIRRKAERADWVIWNGGPQPEAEREVDRIMRELAPPHGDRGGLP